MINLLRKTEWSDDFLLPLTGLGRSNKFEMKSYLFWDKNTITDYKLIVTLSYKDYDELIAHCRDVLFPILDKEGYLLENYDIEGKSIFILDISKWDKDIRMFMHGKYSKMSDKAKALIEKYHTFDGNKISVQTLGILYPNKEFPILEKMTPMEYAAKYYGLDLDEIKKIGEIGSLYDKVAETLVTDESKRQKLLME